MLSKVRALSEGTQEKQPKAAAMRGLFIRVCVQESMEQSMKSVKKNAILNGLRTILNLLFPLITFPYVSRILSVDEVGKFNFSSSIITYFLLIAALGIDKYAVREGAKYRDNRKKLSEFASEVFSVNIISTLFSYLLLFLAIFISKKLQLYFVCILICGLQIIFTTIGTEWLYTIYEEYAYITLRSIVFKVISLVLLFIFVRSEGDYLKYAGVSVFASVGSNILNYINAKKYCDIHFTLDIKWRDILKPVLIIFASNIAIQIYVSTDITMLGFFKTDYDVGIYSVSVRIYNMVASVLSAVQIVAIPRLAMYVGKNQKKEYNELLLKLTNTLMLVVIPAMVGLVLLSKDIVTVIAGSSYYNSCLSLRILCVALSFSILSSTFNRCILIPFKREKKTLYSSIISASANVLLNIVFIPLFSEIGAAITTLIAEGMMAVLNYIYSKDICKNIIFNKKTLKNVITIIFGTIGIIISCVAIKGLIHVQILRIAISVTVSVAVYIVIILALKNEIALEFLQEIKNRMFKTNL